MSVYSFDRVQERVVDAVGELLVWQASSRGPASGYTGGQSPLFPDEDRRLQETVGLAKQTVGLYNDHLEFLGDVDESKEKTRKHHDAFVPGSRERRLIRRLARRR